MANPQNTFVQARDVVDIGIGLLQKDLTIANLFFKNPQIDWTGRPNDTVTVRVPQRLSAARKFGTGWRPSGVSQDLGPSDGSTPPVPATGAVASGYDAYSQAAYGNRPQVVVDSVAETTISVTIDEFIYKALGVTLEDLTLDVPNFVAKYLPQMTRVVAERIEDKCLAQLDAANWDASVDFTGDNAFGALPTDGTAAEFIIAGLNKMRRALNANFVPAAGRTLVVGLDIEDALVLSPTFQRVDSVGNADALREATVGRILGMDVVSNPTIDPDTVYITSPQAFLLNTVTPRVPEGAVQAATTTGNGLSLMYVQDYDTAHMIDRVTASLFAGTAAVEDGPIVSGNRTLVRAARGQFVAPTGG